MDRRARARSAPGERPPSRRSVAVKRIHSEGGERVNSSINVMSLSLRLVMGLRLDKVVAPDTHFSGSSDEPSPFVMASFLIHDIGAFHDLVDFERLLAERAEDIFSIIQHNLVHAAEARTAAADAAPSCFRALGSRKPTNCTIFCGCNSFLPEPSVICCDIGP